MKRIYKYPIPVNDQITLELPKGSEILTIQMQKSEPFIWVLVDIDQLKEERYFYLYGTGMKVKPGLKYIGTFQMLNGGLVFHLFEV
jgi:hypothetical protein